MEPPESFRTTVWDDIRLAIQGNEAAVNRFVRNYRAPVVALIRRWGHASEAEDLAQEVFMTMIQQNLLAKATPGEARFRNLLTGVAKNVVRNHTRKATRKKRGGEAAKVNVSEEVVPAEDAVAPGDTVFFDQMWMVNLLNQAFKRLEIESTARKNSQHEIVRLGVFEKLTAPEIARQMDLDPDVVRNLLHRGKKKLLEFVTESVAAYTEPGPERDAEIRHVRGLIGFEKP